MEIFVRRFSVILTILLVLIETIRSTATDTNSTEIRKGRVNGRIVKLYSGAKPDPILCLEEGFKPDPVDCSVFYRCTKASRGKFTLYRFHCGPGTVYDPETEICNHPSNTKRSECGGLVLPVIREDENEIETQELPSPINTTSPTYTTNAEFKNVTTSTTTPKVIEEYNEYKPISTAFYPSVVTTDSQYTGNYDNLQTHQWTHLQNETQYLVTHVPTIDPSPDISLPCTRDGFIGDNENCRKFYRCVSNSRGGFIKYEFLCSDSTVWDDNIQSCNHAWAARNKRCGRSDDKNKNSVTKEEETYNVLLQKNEVQNSYSAKLEVQQSNNNNDLYDNNLEYGSKLTDNKHSQHKQTEYITTTSLYSEIPSNQLQNKLNHMYEVTEIKHHNNDINEINYYHVTSSPYVSKNLEPNYTTKKNNSNQNAKCIESGFIADPVDCKKFYRCVDNGKGGFTKYEFSCSQETVWDSKIEACNHAWAVKECGGILSAENPVTEAVTSIPIISSTFKETNDNGYINQVNEEHEQTTSSTILTTVSLLSTTDLPKLTSTECTSSGFFGYQNDCQKFYRCVDNERGSYTKYDYLCGEGTLWDQNLKACNHAWAVQSCNQSTMITNTTQATNDYNASSPATTPFIQTTTSKDTSHSDIDSGYTYQSSMTTVKPSVDQLKTTLKYPQSQQNDCESSGFMGDAYDCKKFYRCVDNGIGGFTRHEYSCGENTVWDSEIEACNHAWAVKQCGKNNNGNEEITSQAINDNVNNGYVTPAYNSNSSSQTPDLSSETTTKPTLVTNDYIQCESNGFMGDKLDCKKFYRCVESGDGKYIRYEFSCGEGTVWDHKIQACNHAWAVEECSNNVQVQTTHVINDGSIMPSTSSSNADDNIDITQSTTKIDTLISSTTSVSTVINREQNCQLSGFMGDSIDCKKFYRCVDDGNGSFIKHEFSCGQGTVWDSKIEACNHEWAVENCGKHSEHQLTETTSSMNEIQVTTSPSNSITQIQHLTTTAALTSTTLLSDIENHTSSTISEDKDICTSQGYFGNTRDCKKFYRCVNDGKGGFIKYDFSCGDGSVWVQEMQSCDHYTNETTCSYATNTEKYEESNSSSMQDEQITESGSSISTIKATTSASTTESTRPPNKNECIEDGYFGNTEDCRKFYRCVSNEKGSYTKYDYICGEGTIWDSDITACNHPRDVAKPSCKSDKESATTVSSISQQTNDGNVHLTESTTVSTASTTNKNEENLSSTTASTASTTNKNDSNSTSSNNISTVGYSNNITCTKAGFYANPSDCKKFYRCVDWDNNGEKYSVFHFECGEGTIWDPSLETCNYEESIYPPRICNGTLQQNENITESFSTTEEISTTTISDQTSTTESSSTTQQTTTEQITTQQTTQPTTTQQTTVQPTTTERSTTSQQTTTEQSTTSQSTSQQTTTEQSTTSQSTAQQTTTEQTTTQQTTTQQTTTQQTTTQQTTTQETTTQQTTTEQQSTTEQVSTTQGESTTQLSSTETSTTPASTTQTTESDQTTIQTTQEQTTKSSTEPTTSSEMTTSETTTQSSSTDQVTSSTQPQTTEENISQTDGQSSATEASTTEAEHQSSTEANTSAQDCPETDEDQILLVCPTSFKRHPKYCNIFYQCTEDNESHEAKVATFNCPNNTIYDESKVQCVEEDKSEKKCTGEIAKKHRVKRLGIANNEQIVVSKESMACPGVGHFPFEKHEECSSILLKCELTKSGKLRGYIYKCPEGFVYWSISRRCESLKTLQDCKKPFDGLNKRYDIPIEKYNVAH